MPIDQPPPGFVPISGQPQGWNAVAANALTGLQGGVGNLLGLPNTAAKLAAVLPGRSAFRGGRLIFLLSIRCRQTR
jgi:hypothetical protein